MKKTLIIVALLACAFGAQAQGTMQFHATLTGAKVVPANNDPTIGQGYFNLDANILNFFVDVPAVTFASMNGYIQGPAGPGTNALTIFNLGWPTFHSGSSLGDPPFYRFESPFDGTFGAGPFTLTSQQISDLNDGLWYVNITSASFPNGQLRGQIFEVPEPSIWALFGLGSLVFWLWRKSRARLKFALAVCALAVAYSGSAQPVCLVCPPNHSSYTVTVQPGWSLIAVPLFHFRGPTQMSAVLDNSVDELFKFVPTGTRLSKFENATQQFSENIFHGNHWTNPTQTLLPGEGVFIFNPKRESFSVTISGDCAYGGAVFLPGGLSIISSPTCGTINFAPLVWPTNSDCTFIEATLGPNGVISNATVTGPCPPGQGWDSLAFNPQEGDEVYTFDNASQNLETHLFHNGIWDTLPVVQEGEAFFARTTLSRWIAYTGPVPL